jgi:hypothetical protein
VEALVHERHRTLRAGLGDGLGDEGRILVRAGQLDQENLIGSLGRGLRQALCEMPQGFRTLGKGFIEERLE